MEPQCLDGDERRDDAISAASMFSWAVPAAVRFLSIEPLLGPMDNLRLDGIHWVIAGGESDRSKGVGSQNDNTSLPLPTPFSVPSTPALVRHDRGLSPSIADFELARLPSRNSCCLFRVRPPPRAADEREKRQRSYAVSS